MNILRKAGITIQAATLRTLPSQTLKVGVRFSINTHMQKHGSTILLPSSEMHEVRLVTFDDLRRRDAL